MEEGREKYIAECVDQIFIAAKEDGMNVGFLCLQETGKDTVGIAVMGVIKNYQRNGIGRHLLDPVWIMFICHKKIIHWI